MKQVAIATVQAPAAIGPYSQAIQLGDLLFCSGQVPIDPAMGQLVGTTIGEQTRQALTNVKALVEAAGSSLGQIVKTTVFLTTMDHFQEMNEVYATFFETPQPARSTIAVAGLPRNALVEIECIAYKETSK